MLYLEQAIRMAEYGNNVKICVWRVANIAKGAMSRLPVERNIHISPVCDYFKKDRQRFRACLKCHSLAVKKAVKLKRGFFGNCINGVFEYCYPVVYNGEVVAVIFIGNMGNLSNIPDNIKNSMAPIESPEKIEEIAENLGRVFIDNLSLPADRFDISSVPSEIKEYADRYYQNDISLETLSSYFHYNQKYLGRKFLREYGFTFSNYLNGLRTEKAAELIRNSTESVTEISIRVGFNNVSYFNRIFKEKYGCSPTEYRKNQDK